MVNSPIAIRVQIVSDNTVEGSKLIFMLSISQFALPRNLQSPARATNLPQQYEGQFRIIRQMPHESQFHLRLRLWESEISPIAAACSSHPASNSS